MREPRKILVVDDDNVLRQRLGRALEDRGYTAVLAQGCAQAQELAQRESPHWAIVDLRMPDGNGLDLVVELLRLSTAIQIVVLTGYGSIATALEAMRRGAKNFVTKPADTDEILAAFGEPAVAEQPDVESPSLARAEWEHIHRILHDCDGNISEAARRLGLHRRSLQRKLQKHPSQR